MSDHVEREVKLDADPDLVLPDLDGLVVGLRTRARPVLDLDACYFDTADRRLLAAGVTVRRRTGEGTRWTVKLPVEASPTEDGAVARQEIDVIDDDTRPPAQVLELVEPWAAGAELVELARLRSHRRRTTLVLGGPDGPPVAELDDDLVRVSPGCSHESHGVSFREVEVELAGPGDPEAEQASAAVVAALRSAGCRPAPASSKLARGLALLDADRAPGQS